MDVVQEAKEVRENFSLGLIPFAFVMDESTPIGFPEKEKLVDAEGALLIWSKLILWRDTPRFNKRFKEAKNRYSILCDQYHVIRRL